MHQEHHIQKFTYGNATFETTSQIIKKVKIIIGQSKKIQPVLKDICWDIRCRDYLGQNWKEIFPHMSESFAQRLDLALNGRIQIISQIQYAQYSNIKYLFLQYNKINNIQSLSSIHFNCLQYLDLSKNQINRIKCVNKLSTPSLNYITLYSNPLIEINALTQSKINSKVLRRLWLLNYNSNDSMILDLSVIVKLISESVNQLQVISKKRIKQIKVKQMLKLRFPSIFFYGQDQ